MSMTILVAADIFGDTEDLRTLAASLNDRFRLVSPYARRQPVASEADAYAWFQASGGIAAYADKVAHCMVQAPPDALIGFSAGATAGWLALSKEDAPAVGLGILFYGSRIRDYPDRRPRCPVRLIFAEHEPAFDVGRLADTLAAGGMAVDVWRGCRHGFMNRRSPGYDAAARKRGVTLVRAALAEMAPQRRR